MKKILIGIRTSIIGSFVIFGIIMPLACDMSNTNQTHIIYNNKNADVSEYIENDKGVISIEIYKYPIGTGECYYWKELSKYPKITLDGKEKDEFVKVWITPDPARVQTLDNGVGEWKTNQTGGILFRFIDGEKIFYNFVIGREAIWFEDNMKPENEGIFFSLLPVPAGCGFDGALIKPLLEKHVRTIK